MARALELAARADYRTSPNPMVGAVVLDARGHIAGEGFHERAGTPHAEIHALTAAGDRARGGTLYVTLEPCNHHGRTPPCTEAIIEAGVARVVLAIEDPDPRTRGSGIRRIEQTGIEVTQGLLQTEAQWLNRFYIHQRRTGRPWVTAKFAASLDGRITTGVEGSRRITGDQARAQAHRERHRHDAILVGINTVLTDDPELTARFPNARQPLRVVLDSNLRTPPTAHLAKPGTLIATATATATNANDALAQTGVEIAYLPSPSGRVDLPALLDHLGRRGILSLLVEGGSTVHGAFFDQDLVDGVTAYLAPSIIGHPDALPAVASRRAAPTRLQDIQIDRAGDDLIVSGIVARPPRPQ